MKHRTDIYADEGALNERHVFHFGFRTLNPEAMVDFYSDVFQFQRIDAAAGDPNRYLTDGHVTMVVMPWSITDYDSTGIVSPSMDHIRNDLRVLGDPYGAIAPQFITGSYFTTRAYAAAQPALVTNVARALRRAAAWANGHPNDTAAILARVQKLDVERVETIARSIYAEQLRPSDLQPVFDLAFKYGYLSAHVDAKAMIL